MLKYIGKRLLALIPTLLGITIITFAVMRLADKDGGIPQTAGPFVKISPQDIAEYRKQHHFDKPIIVQYGYWIWDIIRFDFRKSELYGLPVTQVIMQKLPVTIYLNLVSLLIIFFISIPIGLAAAVNHDTWLDRTIGVILFMLYALFVPWVANILMSVFSVKLGWLPLMYISSDGYSSMTFMQKVGDILKHTILPVTVLSYGSLAFYSRLARGAVLEVLDQDYINTARAKGLRESRVVYRHALRNALIPFVTILGALLPSMIGGSVIIEKIFNLDGMGNLFFSSVLGRDYNVTMAILTFSAFLTLIGVLISDILYAVVDPRIRYSES